MVDQKPIPGYPGYSIDIHGIVRNQYGDPIKVHRTSHSDGRSFLRARPRVNGRTASLYIHRAMLLAFRGEPTDPDQAFAAAIDGDHTNIALDNLEWRSLSGTVIATRNRKKDKP